jgi:hypothetical protein
MTAAMRSVRMSATKGLEALVPAQLGPVAPDLDQVVR